MRRQQFLISILPALWEWLAPAGLTLLVMVEVAAAHVVWLPVWFHVGIQLCIGLLLIWLSVSHATDAHLRRRVTPWRDVSGMVTMLVLSAVLISGNGRLLLSPAPLWMESFHRGAVIAALLTLALHLALAPRGRGVRLPRRLVRFFDPAQEGPARLNQSSIIWPLVQPDMTLTEVMMILLDHLRDNNMVDTITYAHNGNTITCQFSLCPFAEQCPLPRDKQLACRQLCILAQETLVRSGYPVRAIPATPTEQTAQVAFHLQLLPQSA